MLSSGYPSSPFTLRPFTEPEVQECEPEEKIRRRTFNRLISNKRIYVEHAFGILKGRFPSLKLFGTPCDIRDVYRAVESLMVVHNLCIDLGDSPHDFYNVEDYTGEVIDEDVHLPGYGGVMGDLPVEIPPEETDEALRVAGQQMRLHLLDLLVPM